MANALADYFGGYQAGNQMLEQQRDQRQRNQLNQLASGVVSGDPQAYAQAAAIDPQAASSYQAAGDQIALRARGAARFLQNALQSGNPQQIAAARQTIKPFMDTLKPGSSYPLDMDPTQELAGLQGFLAQTEHLDPMFKQGTPTDVRSFQMMTAGLSSEDREKARRVNLGLDGRASNAGYGFFEFEGADGRKRMGRNNPRTGAREVYDEASGEFVPLGGAQAPSPQGVTVGQGAGQLRMNIEGISPDRQQQLATAVSAMQAAGIPEDQINATLGAALSAPQQSSPINPALVVGRPAEETAGAEALARRSVELGTLPQELSMRTNAAIQQAAGTEQAKSAVETGQKRAQEQYQRARDANESLDLLNQAEALLKSGATGSGAGALYDRGAAFVGAAPTGAQLTAQLKPIASRLVQKVPRFEGPQSDRDVKQYQEAAGGLSDDTTPIATRLAAIQTLRALNDKYAQIPGERGGAIPVVTPAATQQPTSGSWGIQRVK